MIVFPHVSGEHRGSSTDGFFATNRSASRYVRPLICMYNGKVGLSRPSIVEGLRIAVEASVGSSSTCLVPSHKCCLSINKIR